MAISDYIVARDKFEPEENGGALGFGFPCCFCQHRHGGDDEEPCRTCDHNELAVRDEDEGRAE